jgi:hypothetical protein
MGAYDAALKFLLTNIQDNAPHIVAQVAQGHLAALADEDAAFKKHLDVSLDDDCSDPSCVICNDPQLMALHPTKADAGLIPGEPWDEAKGPKPTGLLGVVGPNDIASASVVSGISSADITNARWSVGTITQPAVIASDDPIAEGDGNNPA